jgi:hypothetical protein
VIYHSNESTLLGLFREGFLHGFYDIQVMKKHQGLVRQLGHRRFHKASYQLLASSLIKYIRREDAEHSLCTFVFNSGKKVGKIVGSMRFFYFDV